jgi:gluconolactonase
MIQTRRGFMGSAAAATLLSACSTRTDPAPSASHVEIFDPAATGLIDASAPIETLSSGYTWSEGPVWDRARNCLYFTDVPGNIAWKWSEASGATEFLNPSGIALEETTGFREPGANGLAIAQDGSLLICNHGRRAIEKMDFATGQRETLAATFNGKKFNSPNDIVEAPDGSLFFTDPPYGLKRMNDSPLKEQDANGVYRLSPDGSLTRLIDTMTFPNGAALSPDSQTLYVSQSDPDQPVILRMSPDGASSSILFDAKPFMSDSALGLPDGMAVASSGHIFATGPGGVFLLSPDGKPLARINTGKATANCCFGDADGQTLYMTAHDTLVRIRTKATGLAWS